MRILFIASCASDHEKRPIDYLLRQGHEVVLLGRENPWPQGRQGFEHIYHERINATLIPVLQSIKETFAPDLMHVYYADLKVLYCTKAAIAPVVVSILGSDINSYVTEANSGYRWVPFMPHRWDLRWALKKVAHVIVDDRTMHGKCRFIAPDCAPISLLHLGIDPSQFRPPSAEERAAARSKWGIAPDDVVLFSPRVCSATYNHHIIMEKFAKLAARFNKAKLFIKQYSASHSKKDEAYGSALVSKAQSLCCASQIQFVPAMRAEELHTLYWAADGMVNYPQLDAFPVTLAEAAATHVPILTVHHLAYEETFAINNAHTTFTDANSLEQAMEAFFLSPVLPLEKLESARNEVLHHYNHIKYTKNLEKIYEQCVTGIKHTGRGKSRKYKRYMQQNVSDEVSLNALHRVKKNIRQWVTKYLPPVLKEYLQFLNAYKDHICG